MIKGSVMEKLIKLAPYQDACLVILRNTNCRNGGLILKKTPHILKDFPNTYVLFLLPSYIGPLYPLEEGVGYGLKNQNMYLYRNNFANIGNNGAVVPENFFFQDKPSIFKI